MSGRKDAKGRIHIVESLLGVLGVTEDKEIIEQTLYPSDPKQISAALYRQSTGEVTREVARTIEKLVQRGFDTFLFNSRALAKAVEDTYGLHVEVDSLSDASDFIRDNMEKLAVDTGFVEDVSRFYALSHEVSVLNTRRAIKSAQSERGAALTQVVLLLNELDKTLNVLSSKLREWHGLHFPELTHLVESHRTYAKIVSALADRTHMEIEDLREIGLDDDLSKAVIESAHNSMGASLMPEDREQMKNLASLLLSLYSYREELEVHIISTTQEVAPNLSEVAGPVLAAKLIEKAGSLRKLAMMPSGTVQLLGAEKALFRAKKSGARPPKHGLIFQHPYVHSKPRKLRGRSARALAGKLAIAARADAFSGNFIADRLKRELSEKEGIMRKPSSK